MDENLITTYPCIFDPGKDTGKCGGKECVCCNKLITLLCVEAPKIAVKVPEDIFRQAENRDKI